MKLFTTRQIAGIDKYTIENEPVADINLMERAALQITNWLLRHFSANRKMIFFAGPGNNGGDALAIARQMAGNKYNCEVWLADTGRELTGSPAVNLQRLKEQGKVSVNKISGADQFLEITETDIIVDGLFGSGLTRPLQGLPAEIIRKLNSLPNIKVAIDIPSGLMGEDNSDNIAENILNADFTLTFQFPKINFLFAENEKFTGKWEVLPIGLHPDGIEITPTQYFFVEKDDVQKVLPPRGRFSHKGTFGHALLIAGSYGKMGAAVLASESCLRSGAGLLTAHVPGCGYTVIQTAVPEAMVTVDDNELVFSEVSDLTPYNAIGAGPGIGTGKETGKALFELIKKAGAPLVLDADALNILSENREWLKILPENTILTPHPGEFRRLAGKSADSWEMIQKQRAMAMEFKVIVVLKGAFTSVALPDGNIFFNSTGNPGMATAGSGDSLTGIILGLLSEGLQAEDTAVAGVFLHGLAGDFAASEKSQESLIAGDIAEFLGKAFESLK